MLKWPELTISLNKRLQALLGLREHSSRGLDVFSLSDRPTISIYHN